MSDYLTVVSLKKSIQQQLKIEDPRLKLVGETKLKAKCWEIFLHVVESKGEKKTGFVACKNCKCVFNTPNKSKYKHLDKHAAHCVNIESTKNNPSSPVSIIPNKITTALRHQEKHHDPVQNSRKLKQQEEEQELHVPFLNSKRITIQQQLKIEDPSLKLVGEIKLKGKCWKTFLHVVECKGDKKTGYVACKNCKCAYKYKPSKINYKGLNKHVAHCVNIESEALENNTPPTSVSITPLGDYYSKNEIRTALKQQQEQQQQVDPIQNSRRFTLVPETKKRARCWDHFSHVFDGQACTGFVACTQCLQVHSYSSKHQSNLNRHIGRCFDPSVTPQEGSRPSKRPKSSNEVVRLRAAMKKAKRADLALQQSPEEIEAQLAKARETWERAQMFVTPEEKEASLAKRRQTKRAATSVLTQEEKNLKNEKRNEAYRRAKEAIKGPIDEAVENLSKMILDMVDIDEDIIKFMATNQVFTRHPKLALAYYHLCELDPNLFVFNDESLIGEEGEEVCQRLIKALGKAIGRDEIANCQESVAANDPASGRIAACASCNEIILECNGDIVDTTLEDLHENFKLTDEQISALGTKPPDIVRDFVSVVDGGDGFQYHLNPDLIVEPNDIVLCTVCNTDPLSHKFSIASGHDYGRLKHFPLLNALTLACCSPVRNYNIDVLLKPRHATGHSICFPSSGPVELAKELPSNHKSRKPHVTFLGPEELWRIEKRKWKNMFRFDYPAAMRALAILVGLQNPAFEGIKIVDSPKKLKQMIKFAQRVRKDMIHTQDRTVLGVSNFVDEEEEEGSHEQDPLKSKKEGVGDPMPGKASKTKAAPGTLVHSAVLQDPRLATTGGTNSGIKALLEIIKPSKDADGHMSKEMLDEIGLQDERRKSDNGIRPGEDNEESLCADDNSFWSDDDSNDWDNESIGDGEDGDNESVGDGEDDERQLSNKDRPVIPVVREAEPLVEWDENDILLAGAFPHLFPSGLGLPKGGMTVAWLKHLFKYYDGRFNDPIFIATAFNQKQRHACIRNTARVAMGNLKKFVVLGKLANSSEFREMLVWAKNNPESKRAKKLNAKVCRMFGMVGKTIPFSPFERVSTRPRLEAMRLRYSAATMFHTGAPPEFENLYVLRVCLIKQFNDKKCPISRTGFSRNDLPEEVLLNTGIRMNMTKSRAVLSAQAFIKKESLLNNDIMKCKTTSDIRVSRNYTERERGAFGPVAAHNTVIEPQQGGRLHWHKMVYLSGLTPTLLNRIAAGPCHLIKAFGDMLDSLSCTHVSDETHIWYEDLLKQKEDDGGNAWPRAADLHVPSARCDYELFKLVAEKKSMLTNMHVHGFSCEKTRKGRFMCRLCCPRGTHDAPTCPLLVVASDLGNPAKGEKAVLHHIPVADDEEIQLILDSAYYPLEGEFMCPTLKAGPIVWEPHRPDQDNLLVEPNLAISNLLECHNNASLITSRDGGEAVEEYAAAYMTKEGAPLRQAAAVLLGAIDYISKHESKADDSGKPERTGKYLAQRTLNSFTGSHQWSMPLMVYALQGYKSYSTTESFTYIFPHDNVSFYEESANFSSGETPIGPDLSNQSIHDLLGSVNELPVQEEKGCSGATSYKVGDKCVFLNQANSYANRGDNFRDYGQLEFECIVELLPKKGLQAHRGRRQRIGFDLGTNHPLYSSHHGFLRTKMRTAILAGQSPPKYPGNRPFEDDQICNWIEEMDSYAKFVMCFMVPWTAGVQPALAFNSTGLGLLLNAWDSRSASLLNRQRFRTINNFMSKGNRNSRNERTASAWRERDATRWKEIGEEGGRHAKPDLSGATSGNLSNDLEAEGKLTDKELHQITVAIADIDERRIQSMLSLQRKCRALHASNLSERPAAGTYSPNAVVYASPENNDQPLLSLSHIQRQIRNMRSKVQGETTNDAEMDEDDEGSGYNDEGPGYNHGQMAFLEQHTDKDKAAPVQKLLSGVTLTAEQEDIVTGILEGREGHDLVFLHSGGGTGKSTVVCKLNEMLESQGFKQANCCPTGVGATHLPQGRTFHSLFKTHKLVLSAGKDIDAMKEELGGDKLKLVVVDEVSMLEARFLILLDTRLKAMYEPDKMFGGIPVLLLGDFLQLKTIVGTALYKLMYGHIKTEETQAKALFSQFKVVDLKQQLRAASDPHHQELLELFRALPEKYPEKGSMWSARDRKAYQPMTPAIVKALTTQLSKEEVENDPGWTTKGMCLTTSNLDRSVINGTIASIFGARCGQTVVRWRRELQKELPKCLSNLLFSPDKYPELFGYFVHGAPGQILDNGSGNVCFGVANGTPCKMISLGWDDATKQQAVTDLIIQALMEAESVIDIPCVPDFIIVQVEVDDTERWPSSLNLSNERGVIHIPIGLKSKRGASTKDVVTLPNKMKLPYIAHAVDLAFSVTTWKSQGGTFDYIIALLEHSHGSPPLSYEMLYVMFSRVKLGCHFRCMPLSNPKKIREKLGNLRPNIFAVRWRMDIGANGRWKNRDQEVGNTSEKKRHLPRARGKGQKANTSDQAVKKKVKSVKYQRKESILSPKRKTTPAHSPIHHELVSGQTHPVLECDGSLLYPSLNLPQSSSCWPHTPQNMQSRVMFIGRSLPIIETANWDAAIPFRSEGLVSLEPGKWLINDPMDLFSLLDCQTDGRVSYIPCSAYTEYLHKRRRRDPYPQIYPRERTVLGVSRAAAMMLKPLWISVINHNNLHWQLLCIINPGKPNCVAMLMDSLVGIETITVSLVGNPEPTFPSNLSMVRDFAIAYVTEVALVALGSRMQFNLEMQACLVPMQDNDFDCGTFALLNLKNCVYRADELVNLSNSQQAPRIIDFRSWYSAETGIGFREYLFRRYEEFLANYSQPE